MVSKHKGKWTLENIKSGFDRFYEENGRLPTVSEVDVSSYLPSSRWLQTKFGGIVGVRKSLGYVDCNLSSGLNRSNIAKRVNKMGLEFERQMERFLVNIFGEQFVHTEKRIGESRNRLDFYVYSVSSNFGVDVTKVDGNFRSLETNINLKIRKYKDIPIKLYIVVEGNFSQFEIDAWLHTKKMSPPSSLQILTTNNFMKIVNKFTPYTLA